MNYAINCDKLVYAMLTGDASTGVTYGEVKDFSEPQEIQIAPVIGTGKLYGSGEIKDNQIKKRGVDVTVNITKLPASVRKDIQGESVDADGVTVVKSTDIIPYFALGIQVGLTGGQKQVMWLLKGKAQPNSQTIKQSEDNVNYSTDSLKVSFIPRDYDSVLQLIGETGVNDFTLAKATTFLETVPTSIIYPAD